MTRSKKYEKFTIGRTEGQTGGRRQTTGDKKLTAPVLYFFFRTFDFSTMLSPSHFIHSSGDVKKRKKN